MVQKTFYLQTLRTTNLHVTSDVGVFKTLMLPLLKLLYTHMYITYFIKLYIILGVEFFTDIYLYHRKTD